MRRCLIVSPHFPPSTLAGVHRARHLAKHLPAHGWKPTILCVDPRYHIEKLDPDLAKLVPPDVEIVRAGAVPVHLTRPFGIAGDIGLRGYVHLRAAVARELARARVDVVLITGSPYYPMLMTSWIRRHWNVPVVLDFQDPWVSHAGMDAPRRSKAGLAHRLAITLEPRAVRNATFITSVSDRQNDEMAARYSWLDRKRMVGIPIGGDPDDFSALGTGQRGQEVSPHLGADAVNFTYAGTIWPPVIPTLRAVLAAVALLRDRVPNAAARLRLNFIGTTANPSDEDGYRVIPLAEEIGVADNVHEVPQRLPYIESLRAISQTEFALLIGSDEPHYTASKIYPVLMAGHPFVAVFHRASSSYDTLTRAGGGVVVGFSARADLDSRVTEIAAAFETLLDRPAAVGQIDHKAYASFTAHETARAFSDVFERATRV